MMAEELRFEGRVVLITGAGRGLGREYALAFGSRGASVVVNDLGGDAKGGGKSSTPADKVVDEIRALGGKAVADYNSVEDGEKVVQTALDAFGRIDILINNAGILRDRSFGRTSDTDWDLVHRVHLRGAFKVTRAAWSHMRKQNYGRIIMTSSVAGILGNFGQANYSAAKLGLVGLSNTLAKEGTKYNIHCNAIAPLAGSRLTQTVMPPDIVEALKPAYVAPFVVYLCHESCSETGGVFEIAAGWATQLKWYQSRGKNMRMGGLTVTPEMVRNNWDKITDWSTAKERKPENALSLITENLEEAKAPSGTETEEGSVMEEGVKVPQFLPVPFNYEAKDVILYALGVGVTVQEDLSHLKFLYEGSEDFCTLPTFGVITAQAALPALTARGEEFLGLKMNPAKLLHGEQFLEIYKPLPTSGQFNSKAEIEDVLDKVKGALVLLKVTTYDDKGDAVCLNQFSLYCGDAGGFGGKKKSDKAKALVTMPSRPPDACIQQKIDTSQAALYRLNGDYNPIHVDPNFAQMGGLPRPLIHGLCTFGIAARHVLKQYAKNDVTKFKAMKARFSKPAYPGQTLQTEMWRNGNRICLQCKVVENGELVLSGAYIDLKDVDDTKTKFPGVNAQFSKQNPSGLKSKPLFIEISKRISDYPDLLKKVKGIFQWNVTRDGKTAGQWIVDLKNEPGSVTMGTLKKGKPDCTITVSDDDLVAIALGKANPQKLFMKGKLKVKGNALLTTKLPQLFKNHAKL